MLFSGLRPRATELGNGQFLLVSSNFQPYVGGLQGVTKYQRSFTLSEDAQIFDCATGRFVLTSTAFYSYSGGTLTAIHTGLPVGEAWSYADFGEFLVFSNGAVNLIRNVGTGVFALDYGTQIPLAGAICRFRGRLIIGDVRTGDFQDNSMVMWSDIGKASFLTFAAMNLARKGTAGSSNLYEVGKILALIPFHDNIIVYGDEGAVILTPTPKELAAGAMAKRPLLPFGIASKRAVIAAGRNAHYTIAEYGALQAIRMKDGVLGPEELDYREFITEPEDAMLSWDAKNRELLIGVPVDSPFLPGESLIINRYGVGKISSCINSLLYTRDGELIVHTTKPIKQFDAMMTSDVLTFDSPGIKTLAWVEVVGSIPDGLYVAASSRANISEGYTNGDWVPVNSAGVAFIGAAGIDFKLHLACVDYTTINIQSVKVTISYDDRRFRMGARTDYGNKDATGADN
jgi:hypothetical protein